MRYLIIILLIFVLGDSGFTQEPGFQSIHQRQQSFYNQWSDKPESFFDSVNEFIFKPSVNKQKSILQKRVFGYHPYWGGSNYLNYQWDKLSDLCYFSYEVDPSTGNPVTTDDWLTSPAIDSAFAHDVQVHLCVTLFSGHAAFFGSTTSQQNLIDNIINLIQTRGAQGVNMDVEALPSSQSINFTNFMIDLISQMDAVLPDAEVSIAAPAVNWSNKFDIPVLKDHIDFFMVMAYDYYWSGSGEAGPVSPLFSMTDYYDYNFSKTISYYQSQGVPNSMIVMGVPYYAYQWPTEGPIAPSTALSNATAYTYSYIRNNASGFYDPENKHRDPNSFAPYFSFQDGGWNQCFIDDIYSMAKKFDIVNRRTLAGIGIWALGYDNGYFDLWDLIGQKFSDATVPLASDTIFDSGGPSFDYYNNEEYTYTVTTPEDTQVHLAFSYINTEPEYDTLWVFDGPDEQSPLIGTFSGDTIPPLIIAGSNKLTLKFHSDAGITGAGWQAGYDVVPVSSIKNIRESLRLRIAPNPSNGKVKINLPVFYTSNTEFDDLRGVLISTSGQIVKTFSFTPKENSISLDLSPIHPGLYFVEISIGNESIFSGKIILE